MATVYQTQFTPHLDTRPALEYGNLEILCDQRGEPSLAPRRLIEDVSEALKNFGPEDYLLPTGSPAVIAVAFALAARKTGTVQMLIWDKRQGRYYPVRLEMGAYEGDQPADTAKKARGEG